MEFKEVQKFTQWWLWLMLALVSIFPILLIYNQLILGKPFGNNPMPDSGVIAFALLFLGIILLFINMKLTTHINDEGIHFKYAPIIRQRSIPWSQIKSAEIVNYGFVGWGIRLSMKYGIVYNTKGNKGLSIQLKNGKKFIIGTQKENELRKFIERKFS